MVFRLIASPRTCRLVIACTIFFASAAARAEASDRWAEQFNIPFRAQIINVLGPTHIAPSTTAAMLTTVAGLNPGAPVFIDTADGGQHVSVVQTIDTATHLVTWSPALPAAASLNAFVTSALPVRVRRVVNDHPSTPNAIDATEPTSSGAMLSSVAGLN